LKRELTYDIYKADYHYDSERYSGISSSDLISVYDPLRKKFHSLGEMVLD
jgi:hypothetical protein